MRLIIPCAALLMAGMAFAKTPPKVDVAPLTAVERAANTIFPDMPRLALVSRIEGRCGADAGVNQQVAYCTSTNVIFVSFQTGQTPQDAYKLAHVYGHAAQVRHGVADVALAAIRARPDEEDKLRGWVTRQVECIAGAIHAAARVPFHELTALFDAEPMVDAHWGRDPLHLGPVVSIGLEARAKWFARGYAQGLKGCTPGEFDAKLLLKVAGPPYGGAFR